MLLLLQWDRARNVYVSFVIPGKVSNRFRNVTAPLFIIQSTAAAMLGRGTLCSHARLPRGLQIRGRRVDAEISAHVDVPLQPNMLRVV